jgi:hypothetical protein
MLPLKNAARVTSVDPTNVSSWFHLSTPEVAEHSVVGVVLRLL